MVIAKILAVADIGDLDQYLIRGFRLMVFSSNFAGWHRDDLRGCT